MIIATIGKMMSAACLDLLRLLNLILVKIGLLLLAIWQFLVSPFIGSHCRYTPTCSQYAAESLLQHGIIIGSWLSLKRVLSCNSLCKGGCDPVPEKGDIQFFPIREEMKIEEVKGVGG